MHEAPRINLGSVRIPAAPAARVPWARAWTWRSPRDRHAGWHVHGSVAAVGCCRVEPTPDYYDLTDFLTVGVALESGQELYRLPDCVPVGAARGQLVTLSEGRNLLAGVGLADGSATWEFPLPGPHDVLLGEHHLYAWREGSLKAWLWSAPGGPQGEPFALPVPAGEIGYLREGGGSLVVYTWRSEPRVHGELTVLRAGHPVWTRPFPEYCDHDLFPVDGGWVLRTAVAVEAFTHEGRLAWKGTGLNRCWLGAKVILGLQNERLWMLERATGEARELGHHAVWDLAVAGEQLWVADRRNRTLKVLDARGRPLGKEPATPDRLYAANGAVYGMDDDGSLTAWR